MSRIKLLTPLLINQIAAGECIERPSSVVKELIENSLDAGATSIQVEIEEAGNRLIKIIDNGCGIEEDDLVLALTSHATSKITQADDLWKIQTLGFRGEALASIASVAEISISSAVSGAKSGFHIEARNNEIFPVQPIGMSQGTTIEVRNLFFNIPGRRKFLKNQSTEFSHISNTILQLAIAFPKVSFKLFHNRRQHLSLQATEDPQIRIQELLGIDTIKGEYQSPNYQLQAYLGLPKNFRSNNHWQFCYINQRYVKDRIALKAFQDSYHEYLPAKNYPVGVLNLQILPSLVDVNVHPTKSEIRHRYSQEIYHIIYQTITSALKKKDLSPSIILDKNQNKKQNSDAANISSEENLTDMIDPFLCPHPISEKETCIAKKYTRSEKQDFRLPEEKKDEVLREASYYEKVPIFSQCTKKTSPQMSKIYEKDTDYIPTEREVSNNFDESPLQDSSITTQNHSQQTSLEETQINLPYQENSIDKTKIFQLCNSYIIYGGEDCLILFDQHALHERILYEQLRQQFQENKSIVQSLLFPEIIDVSPQELVIFQSWKNEWNKIGIEAQITNDNKIEIYAIPKILGKISPKELVLELLHQIYSLGTLDITSLVEHTLATMACKAAIKAGDKLSLNEMVELLNMRKHAENSFHCPHGRPTTVKITLTELEKYFHRR